MATKYTGQNALNKLMQLVKTALNNKADKTNATTSAAGLMSATDKTKLDGIEAGATKTTVDAALDAGSANPVQNKAVKAAMDEKLDKTGGTVTGSLKVDGIINAGNSIDVKGYIDAEGYIHSGLAMLAPTIGLNNDAEETSVFINCSGDNAARITSLGSDGKSRYSRFAVGTPTGDNDAATKAYVDSKVAAGGVTVDTALSGTSTNPVQNKVIKAALSGKMDKSGGTFTGNVSGKYFTGTWLQTTAATDLGRAPGKIAVLDESGWVYYRTPAELKSDIGVSSGGGDVSTVLDKVYPVGSIYMSVNSTNPKTLFGGTWVQIKDRFLLAAGTTYKAGATGGEAAHTLTESEMPSHNHAVYYPNAGAADHSAPGSYPDGPSDSTYYAIGSYTSSAGGDRAHNNMPPYIAVYVWKRTA